MERICGIYVIRNKKDGKCYVGLSVNIRHRMAVHLSALRKGYEENSYLQNAWNKHKEENFEFSIIEECVEECLVKREIYWIKKLKTLRPSGYNISSGGNLPPNNKGTKFTEEHKRKISEGLMGNNNGKVQKWKMKKNSTGYLEVFKYYAKRTDEFLYGFAFTDKENKKMRRGGFLTALDAAIGRDFILWKIYKNEEFIVFKENIKNGKYIGKYNRTKKSERFNPL